MLETLDLAKSLDRDEYRSRLACVRSHLFGLQKTCWESGVGSIVVFEGWDAAGKGTMINALTEKLEPRGFRLHPIQPPRQVEAQMPWLWRFWNKVPNYGEMAIFDQSWYWHALGEHLEGAGPGAGDWRGALVDIADFERTLADDGYVLLKFFLHISREEQAQRMKRLAKSPLTSWQVESEHWRRHRRYDDYLVAVEEMLARTETEWAPWTIVEATNRRWARIRVFDTLAGRLEAALRDRGVPVPERLPAGAEEE